VVRAAGAALGLLAAGTGSAFAQGESSGRGASSASQVVITASRADLLGQATTASQGSVTTKEIQLRPVFRIGQLFESIPGLVVTIHSGEGKANQYLIRGFNLDHGTDFANFVDDMPVNRPTNTHGQGYSDLNFLMPEIASGIDYTKGPYYAAVGDFGSVASSHVRLANEIANQISVSLGSLRDQTLFAGGARRLGQDDRVMGAVEVGHLDGPWSPPQNFKKVDAALRYSHGAPSDGYSLTGLYYLSSGLLTTDQPLRAVQSGLIGPYGTLDPNDASRSERWSLSGHLEKPLGEGRLTAGAYAIHATMTLWNNFTHELDDPINGDQEQQDETRDTFGGVAAYTLRSAFGGIDSETVLGLQARYDSNYIDRRHTLRRTTTLTYCELEQADGPAIPYAAVQGACNADRVRLLDLAPYAQTTIHWTGWLRTVAGLREDYYHATDVSLVTGARGAGGQALIQPKGSLILGPWFQTEVYLSAGKGFHSDDVRGVFGTVPLVGVPIAGGPTPLLAATTGEEVGLRTDIIPKVRLQLALFQQDFVSELRYNSDVGQDEASAPSRRQGVELSVEYRPYRWIELNTDLAFSKARYVSGDLASYGLDGPYIANAPSFIGSFGAIVDNLGPWFGGLQWRILGPYPINDGVNTPQDKGYNEINLDTGYKPNDHLKIQVSVFNLLDSHRNAAAYYYGSRLPGEPAQGVDGIQAHPLEPRSARITVTELF
jgi:outer membrane receptor protein involved in Fe transport